MMALRVSRQSMRNVWRCGSAEADLTRTLPLTGVGVQVTNKGSLASVLLPKDAGVAYCNCADPVCDLLNSQRLTIRGTPVGDDDG